MIIFFKYNKILFIILNTYAINSNKNLNLNASTHLRNYILRNLWYNYDFNLIYIIIIYNHDFFFILNLQITKYWLQKFLICICIVVTVVLIICIKSHNTNFNHNFNIITHNKVLAIFAVKLGRLFSDHVITDCLI